MAVRVGIKSPAFYFQPDFFPLLTLPTLLTFWQKP
jgi:hypothetical protein